MEAIYCDYSKNHLTEQSKKLLLDLAQQQDVTTGIDGLSSIGSLSNHVLLRDNQSNVCQKNISTIASWYDKFANSQVRGSSGRVINDIVHLGVGGSHLGPKMLRHAFAKAQNHYNIHYTYAMDGQDLAVLLQKLNPHTTLFIIASKSFSTIDTLANADLALAWLTSKLSIHKTEILGKHFVAISASSKKMTAWGIATANQLLIDSNTVGRYSMWSNMGLPIALDIGLDNFKQFLAGANAMDKHFQTADLEVNLPVVLGMVAVWNHIILWASPIMLIYHIAHG